MKRTYMDDARSIGRARPISSVLVVESNARVLRSLVQQASLLAPLVLEARTVAEALEHLQRHPDLIILVVRLSEGSSVEVARVARDFHPRPMIVALSGKASASEAFALARLGVGAYLTKPLAADDLAAAVEELSRAQPCVCEAATDAVGLQPLPDVQRSVRIAMLEEALARTDGNNSLAAQMLGISRQAVQQHCRSCRDGSDSETGD